MQLLLKSEIRVVINLLLFSYILFVTVYGIFGKVSCWWGRKTLSETQTRSALGQVLYSTYNISLYCKNTYLKRKGKAELEFNSY